MRNHSRLWIAIAVLAAGVFGGWLWSTRRDGAWRTFETRLALRQGDRDLRRGAPREALGHYSRAIELASQRRRADMPRRALAIAGFQKAVYQLRADPEMKLAFVGEEVQSHEVPHWSDPDCGTATRDLGLVPKALIEEVLRRDFQGEFLQSSPWLYAASSCPNYSGGPDRFYVVTGYSLRELADHHFEVIYESAGTMAETFMPKTEQIRGHFVVNMTPWGWKLKGYDNQKVSPSAALRHLEMFTTPTDAASREYLRRLANE